MESEQQQLRNLRDFLMVYNRMTEICFQRCSSNFNYRSLTMDEERCADNCAGKLIRSNHRLMGTYVQLMPKMVQRRMEEMESKAAEAARAVEAAGAGASEEAGAGALPGGSAVAESPLPLVPAETPQTISSALSGAGDFTGLQTTTTGLPADVPVMQSPGPVLGDTLGTAEVPAMSTPVLNPAWLESPADLVPTSSVSISAAPMQDGNMAIALPAVTPAAVPLSSLSEAVSGTAFTVVPPLESPSVLHGLTTTNVGVSAPIVPGNSSLVISVPPTMTPAATAIPVEVASVSSSGLRDIPHAPAAPGVPAASAPVMTPNLGLPEGVTSPPVLAPSGAPSQMVSIPVTRSSDVSFSPSIESSAVTKQDSPPPS
ncbi:mitochondrial import inner membrane translocase subunit Tim10 B [Osmerus eperlanus]|uniref:mitochondrial import inner membrane translocase subunit Tim10 B n=1 Tax=Osmerus eperlanus TaxID=29151 RepID=UPI002E118675